MARRRNKFSAFKGFTLLELIVVLAGLGILSSLAIPNFMRLLDFNNIDEAKALLNTAAADCLQKSRLNDADSRDLIDDEILSDKRLNTIGYKIDSDAQNCSYLQILPTNDNDEIRFPIGFSVLNGKLSKFAEPNLNKPTDKETLSSCNNWAGEKCEQDESLKELIAWINKIGEEKTKCENAYSNYIQTKTLPYTSNRWNTKADSGCPTRPPKNKNGVPDYSYKTSNTCRTTGCERTVYGLDGEFVGFTKEEYDKALEAKYGKLCTEWVAQKEADKYTNDPPDQPQKKSPECGDREFWFFNGEDQGSANGILEAQCKSTHEAWRTKGENKRYDPIGGPGECGKEIFVCNSSLVSDDIYFSTEECGKPIKGSCSCWFTFRQETPKYCLEHEQSTYMIKSMGCGSRPAVGNPNEEGTCGQPGRGRPANDVKGWFNTKECATWAYCMGYLYEGLGCQRYWP